MLFKNFCDFVNKSKECKYKCNKLANVSVGVAVAFLRGVPTSPDHTLALLSGKIKLVVVCGGSGRWKPNLM